MVGDIVLRSRRKKNSKRFSKFVVTYCLIAAPLFTGAVMYFNWMGVIVQTEVIAFFGVGFLAHLFTVAWVTVTKEKCKCQEDNHA